MRSPVQLQLVPMRRLLPVALLAQALVLPGWAQDRVMASAGWTPVPVQAAASAADPELRVLLLQAQQLQLMAIAQPFQLRSADGTALGVLEPGQLLPLAIDPATPTGFLRMGGAEAPPMSLTSDLWIEPVSAGGLLQLQQRQYRGRVQVRRLGDSLQVINHVALETYLPSVVGSEMPASWPQSALRAQAVAARTYALRQRRPEAPLDLQATVSSQVYKGVESETPSTREAVAATRGQVLTHGGALIEAVFHSSSGGSTEASGELWSQQLPYLVAVPDFDEASPVRQWQERFDPDQLRQLLPETGGVQRMTVSARSSGGRLRQVRIEGPLGSLSLSGAQLRKRLGLRSTWIELELIQPPTQPSGQVGVTPDLQQVDQSAHQPASLGAETADLGALAIPPPPPLAPSASSALPLAQPLAGLLIRGRGFGHGIGMSQWGAYGLARRGASYNAILSHYYPGTQLDAYLGP